MSKIFSTKKTNAIFLILILIAGTVTTISQSSIIGTAVAAEQAELNYVKNNYFQSKDSSSIVKKIKYNTNINTNVNDLKSNDIGTFAVPVDAKGLGDLVIEQDISNVGTVGTTSTFGNDKRNNNGDKQNNIDSTFVGINNNNNNERKLYAQQQQQIPQVSFAPPFSLASGPGVQIHPHVASSENNVHVSWTDEGAGVSHIYYARSNDGGISFSSPIIITDNSNNDAFSFLNAIAVSGNYVYIVWTSVTTQTDILMVKSTDGGINFSSPIKLNTNVNDRLPTIAASGQNVYVAWQAVTLEGEDPSNDFDSEIFFTASTNGGETFSIPQDISKAPDTLSRNPSLAGSGSNIYLVWEECALNGTNCNTKFASSIDNGTNFSSPKIIVNAVSMFEDSHHPDIAVIGNTLYVVFDQLIIINNQFQSDIYLITSSDGGTNFNSPVLISNGPDRDNNPSIDASDNNIGITWEKRDINSPTSHWEVFFTGSIDGGTTFSIPISLSSSLTNLDSTLNEIALSGFNVYSVWTTFTFGSDFDIFFTSGLISTPTPTDNVPPIITINSAMDGYNIPITNQIGTTISKTITFDFSVTDNVGIESVECYLDDNPVDCLPNPVTYTVQSTGPHTFRIEAKDTSNNPSSAQFVWTVLTLQEDIEQIIQTIDSMDLPQGVANSLKGPLHQTTEIVSDNNPNNDNAACNKLITFIQDHVNYYLSIGQLTQDQANLLTQQAQTIRLALGCQ